MQTNSFTRVDGDRIIRVFRATGEEELVATCRAAREAENLLCWAWKANARREYTKAARLIAGAERLPDFRWARAEAE